MGSVTYNFLSESFLFNDKLILDNFETIAEKEIISELRKYREFVLNQRVELEKEVLTSQSNLKVFSGLGEVNAMLLKQGALYIEQFVLDDPLFKVSYEKNELQAAYFTATGGKEQPIDRMKLCKTLKQLKWLTPMIAANYVKILPISYLFEPPPQIPITYSPTAYADELPEEILKRFHENSTVVSMSPGEGGGWVIKNELHQFSNPICVQFGDGDSMFFGMEMWHGDLQMVQGEKGEHLRMPMSLGDFPNDPQLYKHWVYMTINKHARSIYQRLCRESNLASQLGACYLTQSNFVSELLNTAVPAKDSISADVANMIVNLELPILEKVDEITLMRIRTDDGEAFQSFRVELDRRFRDLRLINDASELRAKCQNTVQEITESKIHDINQILKSAKMKVVTDTGIAIAGLVGTVQTGGLSLLATATALIRTAGTINDARDKVRQNPSYFLWKVLRKSKK